MERITRRRSELVYFVQAQTMQLVKVGVASDVRNRLSALRTGSPDQLALLGVIRDDDACGLERMIHDEYRNFRSHGEWYQPADSLMAFIAEHAVSLEADDRHRAAAIVAKVAANAV